MFQPGTTLGEKYHLLSLLGEGGFGEVYAAENTWTGKRVAIKTLRAEIASDAVVLQRFYQEARAVCRIEHPNVVQVYDLGADREHGVLFIVQELLNGRSLEAHLDESVAPLDPREAVALIVPVMEALEAAHRQGIVHRDVKPGNVLLSKNSHGVIVPKMIDFGISKIVTGDDRQASRTHTGVAIGTPLYMSIEQARGDKGIDAQTDVWSVGVMLYEMVSGRFPFEGNNHNVVIANIIYQPPQRLEAVAPHLPSSFVDVVHRAFEKDRAVRYASMADFIAALRACEPALARERVALPPKVRSIAPSREVAETLSSAVVEGPTPVADAARAPAVAAPVVVPNASTEVAAAPSSGVAPSSGAASPPRTPPDRSTQTNWSGELASGRVAKTSRRLAVVGALTVVAAIAAGVVVMRSRTASPVAAIAASSRSLTEARLSPTHAAEPVAVEPPTPSPAPTPAVQPAAVAQPVVVTEPAQPTQPAQPTVAVPPSHEAAASTPSTTAAEHVATPRALVRPSQRAHATSHGAATRHSSHRSQSGLDIDESFNPRPRRGR